MKIFDKKTKNIILYHKKTDSNFWDNHWNNDNLRNSIICRKHPLIKKILDKCHIDKEAKLLEAGCGIGNIVYYLNFCGYKNIYGIDYAESTVKKINILFPELKVSGQDIRNTNFSDNFFDAYFSFGVIEHYFNGYDDIIKEAKRILAFNGYMVVSFPYMSSLRMIKAKFGFYIQREITEENFYQYIFCKKNVINSFKKNNFYFVGDIKYDGIKGLKDEIKILSSILQKVYDYQGENKFIRLTRSLIDEISKIFASHMILLIFKKNEQVKEL